MEDTGRRATILERRVKGRAAMMGLSLSTIASMGGVSFQSVCNWLQSGRLTRRARIVLRQTLAVSDVWLESTTYKDVGDGLDSLLAAVAA